ncbi:MAG: transcriptional regulator, LysR family-like protein [Ramlibacter sp.]|jgi:DNA-binding transcriptional LysR family regulator|nr:transcriptional regulator, LysR family-like protein [Ramlibacter sp.]
MRDLDLTTLRLFVAVCDAGNIARAGEKSSIVGSAISKRLAQLEAAVGTPLLVRKRHGVTPTPAGQSLLEHARGMLAGAGRIERDMQAFACGLRGQVRILASASAMAESLADDVAAFLKIPGHRSIQVDMEERISPEVVRGVRDGTASLGVCWDAADIGNLQHRRYRSDHLCMVVPPDHPLAASASLRFEQTLDYDHVSLPVSSAVQVMLQRAAARIGRSVNYRVIVSNFEAALRVVRAGLAISLVPREVAAVHADAWGLRLIPLAEPWARRRFIICFRDAKALSPAAQLLADHLAQPDTQ